MMWNILKAGLIAAGSSLFALAIMFQAAQAMSGKSHVTVKSHYSNGTVVAASRKRGNHYEVRLPGGSWLDCAGDCREEYRRKWLDLRETRNERSSGGGS